MRRGQEGEARAGPARPVNQPQPDRVGRHGSMSTPWQVDTARLWFALKTEGIA